MLFLDLRNYFLFNNELVDIYSTLVLKINKFGEQDLTET